MPNVKTPAVYIVASGKHGTLYTGVTSNLPARIYQHKNKTYSGFSAKNNCVQLVYYEIFEAMEAAIIYEKRLKAGPRKQKIQLIQQQNPEWLDLYNSII
jgi:putative endonuclease